MEKIVRYVTLVKMKFHPTTTTYKQGARTLIRDYYTNEKLFTQEQHKIFAKSWNCVGRVSQLIKPGDYFLTTIANESLIVVKDSKETIHALFNVCRHRGTRICEAKNGHFIKNIQCSYHAWTYDTEGKLITAPHMYEVKNFNRKNYGLFQAAVALWEGFIFINIDKRPKKFESVWQPMIHRLNRFKLHDLAVGHKVSYDVAANWKLIFQNYNECLHCPTMHPELSAVLPYKSGANDLIRGPFLGGYMEITEPNESATMNGRACGGLISPDIPKNDQRHAYYYSLMPNLLLSIHPDYANYYLIHPTDVNHTRVESEWLFPTDTMNNPKNNIASAVEFWDVTNRQDWDIVARNQLGVTSIRYVPGPYSPRESIPAAWDREYLRQMTKK